jgi:hypothetical protein
VDEDGRGMRRLILWHVSIINGRGAACPPCQA